MLERKVDGIAVMTSEANEALVTQLGMQRIPITFLDNKPEGADFGIVRVDYARGIGEAVDHLLSLGHTCYAFIGGPAQLRSSAMRHEAFSRHLAENSRNGCIAIEVEANLTIDGGFQAMNAILERQQRVTAVMAANDLLAIGTLRAVRKAGFRVPQDISVVGFDDIHLAEYTEPPLTTVRLARDLLARRVVNSLISKVEAGGARLEAAEPVHTALVLRESTAAAARARVHTV
jgi:LacI family transcriptional regulator